MEKRTFQERLEKVRKLTLPISGGAASSNVLGRGDA